MAKTVMTIAMTDNGFSARTPGSFVDVPLSVSRKFEHDSCSVQIVDVPGVGFCAEISGSPNPDDPTCPKLPFPRMRFAGNGTYLIQQAVRSDYTKRYYGFKDE